MNGAALLDVMSISLAISQAKKAARGNMLFLLTIRYPHSSLGANLLQGRATEDDGTTCGLSHRRVRRHRAGAAGGDAVRRPWRERTPTGSDDPERPRHRPADAVRFDHAGSPRHCDRSETP